MSKKEKLILKLLTGKSDANFNLDFRKGALAIVIGSYKDGIEGIINLQKTKDGKAKSYQVKQVRGFLVNNQLLNDDE